MFNNCLLTERGLGGVLEDASRQTAGEIGLLNTTEWLLRFGTKQPPLGQQGTTARLQRLPGAHGPHGRRGFAEISDEMMRSSLRLKEVYKTVDQVEFYAGIFAEPVHYQRGASRS